jgi:probable phosphoglycerate mutase
MIGGVRLMRHGALPPNPERRLVGRRDLALAEIGRRQALAWHERLADIPFAALVSSDLGRCVETAQLVKGQRDIPLVLEPAFREISLGAWEGLTPEEVERRFPGAYAARGRDLARFRPEGGESFADAASRVLPAFGRLLARSRGQPLLIVGHAGVNRVILAHCLALPLQYMSAIPQPFACCTTLALEAG